MDSTRIYVGCIPNMYAQFLEGFFHFSHRKMMFHKNFVFYLTLITIPLTIYTQSLVYANSTNEDYDYEEYVEDISKVRIF